MNKKFLAKLRQKRKCTKGKSQSKQYGKYTQTLFEQPGKTKKVKSQMYLNVDKDIEDSKTVLCQGVDDKKLSRENADLLLVGAGALFTW